MKKIKLFALAAFAMLSINAMAAEVGTKFAGANGVMYQVSKAYTKANPGAGTDAVPGEVIVVAYSQSATTTAVVIPGTIQNTNTAIIADVPLENIYNVVGIAAYGKAYDNSADAEVTVFQGAKSTSISLPASLKNIGAGAFKNCEAATIEIPSGSQLMTIGNGAFQGCAKLATFATANATLLNTVGTDAFYGCTALTAFTANQFLTTIGSGAFIGTGITKLDLSACKNFETTNNGSTVDRWFTGVGGTYVEADAKNNKLTQVILPTSLADTDEDGADPAEERLTIAANAFDGCTALVTIGTTANSFEIPAYVSVIGDEAFVGTGVTKFDLSKNAEIKSFTNTVATKFWFTKTVANVSTSTLQQIILNKAFDGSSDLKKYTISATDLANISTLTKIGTTDGEYQLPVGTKLVAGMFAGTSLAQLDLSNGVQVATAGQLDALFGANGITTLTTVKLPQALTILAANAFYGCTGLTSLTVKDKDDLSTITSIGEGALYRTALTSLKFGAALVTLTTPFKISAADAAVAAKAALPYSAATALSIDLSTCTALEGVLGTAAAAAKILGDNAFKGVAALTSIKLPTNLEKIGTSALEGTGITSIELPKSIVQDATAANRGLKANAFKDCKSLTLVSFEPEAASKSIFEYDGNDAGDDAAKNVFKGCSLVKFATTTEYTALFVGTGATYSVPVNVVMEQAASKIITTKLDNKTKGYAMKGFYDATNGYKIKIADVTTVYEAYLNNGDVVLSRLKKKGDYYEIPKGLAVIVRTSEAKDVEPIKDNTINGTAGSSLLGLDGGGNFISDLKSVAADKTPKPEANYIYALTNKASEGFAFSFYTGATLNNGSIYVVSPKAPSASGRLNIVFLDEDGNIEDEATAIKSIEKKAENNGVRYNLAGQKVGASYKGVVIKDGKKYIQK